MSPTEAQPLQESVEEYTLEEVGYYLHNITWSLICAFTFKYDKSRDPNIGDVLEAFDGTPGKSYWRKRARKDTRIRLDYRGEKYFFKKGSYLSEYEFNEVFTIRQWDLIRAFHDLSKGIQRDLTAKDCDELCTLSQREYRCRFVLARKH